MPKTANSPSESLRTKAADISPTDVSIGPAVVRYGGTRIYGPDEQILRAGLDQISNAILSVCGEQASLEINPLLGLCRRTLGFTIRRNLFQACLGAEARIGNVEPVLCRSERGHVYRIIVHAVRLDEYASNLSKTIELAEKSETLIIKTLQDAIYPGRAKGSWFLAQHLVQRLAYLGLLVQTDKYSFRIPATIRHGQAKTNGKLLPIDCAWLA